MDLNFSTGIYSGLATPAASFQFPEILTYRDAFHLIAESPESAPLLGVDGEGNPISVDLDSDSPHVLISAASGGGKSVLARGIATQFLVNGADVVFLDVKRHSHRWAKNLPGVTYAAALPDIGNALVKLGEEVHRRNEIVEQFAGPIEEAPVGDRIVVVLEELNATMTQLKGLSKKLPRGAYTAEDAFRDIMFMGRAAKVHVVAVAQYATVEAMGGGDIRENFSTRILIRYTKNAWTMLAYDCGLPQPAPEEPGRGMVCRGGKARQVQFLYLTEEEAAAMVREAYEARVEAGEAAPPPPPGGWSARPEPARAGTFLRPF
ncbi:helicase HerA domain-containing protein [Streptomyces sp. NPDC015131]|uniref:helicase HerA domain-containing protein n=1 Tax=Streptomyces sp. NPDC015131 TaxID=3364941 RepID=UPI0036F652D1